MKGRSRVPGTSSYRGVVGVASSSGASGYVSGGHFSASGGGAVNVRGGYFTVSGGSSKAYGIYVDADKNFFSGNVGIGTSTPTSTLDVIGDIRIHEKDLYLKGIYETNHGLGWYGSGKTFADRNIDGPVLYGYSRGALGTTNPSQKIMLQWDAGSFDFYGYVRFNVLSSGSTSACLDANNSISSCSSDARMKKEVATISEKRDVLDALSKLRGVTFSWDTSNVRAANMPDGQDMGMIAQEVEEVFPEIVHTDKDGYKSLDYPKLVAFLIEVNKVQQAQLNTHQEELGRLSRIMGELNTRLAAVEGTK